MPAPMLAVNGLKKYFPVRQSIGEMFTRLTSLTDAEKLQFGNERGMDRTAIKGAFTFGKMENPFVFSEVGLGMDVDYTPEGGAFTLENKVSDMHTLRWINGAFILDELSASSSDPYLLGSQLRFESKWSSNGSDFPDSGPPTIRGWCRWFP